MTAPVLEHELVDMLQVVEEPEIACDWHYMPCCHGERAKWIILLVQCSCGYGGHRIVCTDCKEASSAEGVSAECRMCGEVISPFRHVIARIEPLA